MEHSDSLQTLPAAGASTRARAPTRQAPGRVVLNSSPVRIDGRGIVDAATGVAAAVDGAPRAQAAPTRSPVAAAADDDDEVAAGGRFPGPPPAAPEVESNEYLLRGQFDLLEGLRRQCLIDDYDLNYVLDNLVYPERRAGPMGHPPGTKMNEGQTVKMGQIHALRFVAADVQPLVDLLSNEKTKGFTQEFAKMLFEVADGKVFFAPRREN